MPGRTQVYERIPRDACEADKAVGVKPAVSRKVLGYATELRRTSGGEVVLRHHNSNVVTYHRDGAVTINLCGYYTRTTVARVNRTLPEPWRLIARRNGYEPLLVYGADTMPVAFGEPMKFYANGDVGYSLRESIRRSVAEYEALTPARRRTLMNRELGRSRPRRRPPPPLFPARTVTAATLRGQVSSFMGALNIAIAGIAAGRVTP